MSQDGVCLHTRVVRREDTVVTALLEAEGLSQQLARQSDGVYGCVVLDGTKEGTVLRLTRGLGQKGVLVRAPGDIQLAEFGCMLRRLIDKLNAMPDPVHQIYKGVAAPSPS